MTHRLRRLAPPLAAAALAALALASTAGANHDGVVQTLHPNTCASSLPCLAVNNTGDGNGVFGASTSGTGVIGVHGSMTGTTPGVHGTTSSSSAGAAGVRGETSGTPGAGSAGVHGRTASTNADTYGVFGEHNGAGIGVYGIHGATSGTQSGVLGVTNSTDTLATGVYGEAPGNGPLVTGVYGGATHGIGLLGFGGNVALAAINPTGGLAGYFGGNVYVNGTLAKAAGAFRIDHPLDPARQYLQHSFVESPDMKNVYDGVARTDRRGYATVRLPRYFGALNRDFRYQLTPIGRAAWDARAGIWQEIRQNRFVIRSEPRTKISWQVTGIRKDAYANAHRIDTEVIKPAAEQGRYLNPDLYGKPASAGTRLAAALRKK